MRLLDASHPAQIWNTAGRQMRITGSIAWPGDEVLINGVYAWCAYRTVRAGESCHGLHPMEHAP